MKTDEQIYNQHGSTVIGIKLDLDGIKAYNCTTLHLGRELRRQPYRKLIGNVAVPLAG
jgi:hypothetical protein